MLCLILSLVSQPALAVVEGVVYVDEDADGVRDADEPGRAGILVSNSTTSRQWPRLTRLSGESGETNSPRNRSTTR